MPSVSQLRRGGEGERAAIIRHMADEVCHRIESEDLGEAAARSLVGDGRFHVGLLVPNQMELFDRIYSSRFERLIAQFIRGES